MKAARWNSFLVGWSLMLTIPAAASAFTTNRLVLQQGVIPTTNGVNVGATA